MEFKKYSEIENSYRKNYIDYLVEHGFSGGEWIVEEKIHGSQFTIYYNGFQFKCSKKTAFIVEEDGNFFNYEKVLEENKEAIIKLWDLLGHDNGENNSYMQVYGEIFGGVYSHPDVPKSNDDKKVQGGIYYHPKNKFYAFDLKVNGNLTLTMEKVKKLFKEAGLFHAETLFKGTFQEALDYNPIFLTTIPSRFGLPEIENNYSEGIVIKPNEHKRTGNGARILIKNKHPDHQENKKPRIKKPRVEIILSEEGKYLYEKLSCLINDNRLKNVLSKVGNVNQKDFGKIMGMLVSDAIEEFRKDHDEEFQKLPTDERKKITKTVNKEAGDLIRPNFLNIIDDEF